MWSSSTAYAGSAVKLIHNEREKIPRRNIMPRGDRTGPNGMGPMTGRAFGFCAGNNAPGYASAPGPGRGMAWGGGRGYAGFGRGMAWNRPEAPAAPENRKAVLEDEMSALEERM